MELIELSKELTETGLSGLLHLWNFSTDPKDLTAFRDSHRRTKKKDDFFPTSTFHWATALAAVGILGQESEYKSSKSEVSVFDFVVPNVGVSPPTATMILSRLLYGSTTGKKHGWVDKRLKKSSHANEEKRLLIPTSHLAELLNTICNYYEMDVAIDVDKVAAGAAEVVRRVTSVFLNPGTTLSPENVLSADHLLDDPYLSPYLALAAATSINDSLSSLSALDMDDAIDPAVSETSIKLTSNLKKYFEFEVHTVMAHRGVELDPYFDPVSLAFALRGLDLLDESFRETAFFGYCLTCLVESQHLDGCWSDGVSVSFTDTGDSIQQQSIEVCMQLASAVFRPIMLQQSSIETFRFTGVIRPSLLRMSEYLKANLRYQEFTAGGKDLTIRGWVSDRIRAPGIVETWTTALATRLALKIYMLERVHHRANVLEQFNASESPIVPLKSERHGEDCLIQSRWVDSIVRSNLPRDAATTIHDSFLRPVVSQWESGKYTLLPDDDSTSFIVFGPPGSGKTFFVGQLAVSLGWPLVEFNPGHFIGNGLDMIESEAAKIFSDLLELEHAVVFFDECDELFRDRDEVLGSNRNILSFVTACMLPKLQDLHDDGRIMFVLATNYLRRIDRAVRRPGRFDRVLLLDRPDETACKNLISSSINKRFPDPAKNAEVAKELAKTTAGLSAKEIIAIAKTTSDGTIPIEMNDRSEQSRNDYLDWCIKDGSNELEQAGFKEDEIAEIKTSWKRVPNYAELQDKLLKDARKHS